MADKYSNNVLSSRAIYPSRYLPYVLLLVASKFTRSFGIFLSYDLLKTINIVQFLFVIKAGAAILLVILQRPFSSGKKISKNQWFRIGRHAVLGSGINLLWLFGLTLCGPLRSVLLYEHSDLVIIAGASAIYSNTGGPSKFRGAVFFLIAVIGLLLFDHDDFSIDLEQHGHHSSIMNNLFNHLTNWTGLSDHKGGVLLLFLTLCAKVGYSSAAKRLSVDIGGSKRLHALSTLVSAALLLPWAAFTHVTKDVSGDSILSHFFPIMLISIILLVADYYIEAICQNHMEVQRTVRFGTMAVILSAMVLSALWGHPYTMKVKGHHGEQQEVIMEEHALSGGVIFSFVLFMFAVHILTSPGRGSKGSFIGYSPAGLPLYSFTGEALQRTSYSVFKIAKNGFKQIIEESDSRKIFYFLCLNLIFTFVELIYGAWTNSLGLISDGFHMLFDCSALVMGLYAAVMSHWPPTRIFSYGYDRVEILSGFINALFLMVIAFFVFTAAMTRLFDPPEVNTEKLMTVSVAGLVVNLLGILAFRGSHGHSHGGGHGHSHSGGHGHSHGGGQGHSHGGGHGHSHSSHSHSQSSNVQTHNTNMEGVFLHVLADTLGSVGVIVSSFLIEQFGWKIADPICSLFISILIFASVLPLVKETSLILLLRTPEELQKNLGLAIQKILTIDGVLSCRTEHFWRHSSSVVCGTLHIQIKPDASEHKLISQVTSSLREEGIQNLTIQLEKETFFQHMSGLGSTMDSVMESSSNSQTLTFTQPQSFIKAV